MKRVGLIFGVALACAASMFVGRVTADEGAGMEMSMPEWMKPAP